MTEQTPAVDDPASTDWEQPSLQALAGLQLESVPAFEVLFLDDVAAYLMGAGPLEPPFTVEHGSRVVSALFRAMVNANRYEPEQVPAESEDIAESRAQLVLGAHRFAELGADGLARLVNRLIPAILGELETHKDSPEQQARSLFYYSLLAVASGPGNLLSVQAAAGALETFHGWDALLGNGLVLPWRRVVAPSD